MTAFTVNDVKAFYSSDKLIAVVPDARIQFWIDDIVDKGIMDEDSWGKLYKNGFMALLGHFLYYMELPVVSTSGAMITSDGTAKVSRSFAVKANVDNFDSEYSTTKYGRQYLSLLNRLAVTYGGFVCVDGGYL
jgi:hypothetical protein